MGERVAEVVDEHPPIPLRDPLLGRQSIRTALDQALAALLSDLRSSGLLDEVLVLVTTEFGRTPKINKNGGRDHWPKVGCALLAGGGMRTGQLIGATKIVNDVGYWLARLWMALVVRELVILGHAAVFVSSA